MAKTINFVNEQSLGGVVKPTWKICCNWSPKRPISNVFKVTRDVCGHKFSHLCGFTFESNLDMPFFALHPELNLGLQGGIDSPKFYKIFQVVYCPKTRSNMTRNLKALSGWYLWQHRAVDDKRIMSINDFYAYYGFDIGKFFLSDLFQTTLPKIVNQVKAAYGTTVKDFLATFNGDVGYTAQSAKFFAKCAFDSLEKIGDVLRMDFNSPEKDAMKAHLAYNADDTYSLDAKTLHNLDQTSGVNPTGTKIDNDADPVNESKQNWKEAKLLYDIAKNGYEHLQDYILKFNESVEFDNLNFLGNCKKAKAFSKTIHRIEEACETIREICQF